jgi:hypothetical protein
MVKNILYFFAFLVPFTLCAQEDSKSTEQKTKSGLLIEHGGYRGSEYTDSMGKQYNLRCNPIFITNDTTVTIHIQIAFAEKYDYPKEYDDEQFQIFPLPEEWAGEKATDSMMNSMFEKLPIHIDNTVLNKTIEPGEKISFAIGIIYPKPAEIWWVVPNELLTHRVGEALPSCVFSKFDWLMDENSSSKNEIMLGLKLHLDGRCRIIPCGQIFYPKY